MRILSLAFLLSLAVWLPVRAATAHTITSAAQNLIRRALSASRLSALLAVMASGAHGVTMDWVTIGAPGNLGYVTNLPCLPSEGSLRTCGAVDYVYQISKYEVTNAQYVEFLNAVAASDAFGLFNPDMESDDAFGGITRLGIDGSYTYAAKGGFSQLPVTYVSFYDSLRFVNWLQNGQPIGGQDATTTEAGSYTITAQGIADNSIVRNAGATIVLPSENEWIKAAHYDPVGDTFFDYPVSAHDWSIRCVIPELDDGTAANCGQVVGTLTAVGSYQDTTSHFGTLDQGGNVYEWTDEIVQDAFRQLRGGGWDSPFDRLRISTYTGTQGDNEFAGAGIRVALVPEPGTALLLAFGLAGLAAAGRRRAPR